MYKILLVQFLLLLSCINLYAQNKQEFELSPPEVKVKNSLYNSIKLLDCRSDTTNIGFVQTGLFNRKATVVAKKPLAQQFSILLNSLTDSTAKHGELLLQLRQLGFAEVTGSVSEKGYCYFNAQLYSKKAGQYQLTSAIDTVVLVKAMDVTNGLLKAGSATIGNFIAANLLQQPHEGNFYTYREVLKMDSVEKRKIKLYNTATYVDGLYSNYKLFMEQTPDKQIVVEGYQIYPDAVKAKDENGKLKKVQAQNIYAIVYKGQPYIASKHEYYPLKKVKDDFLFTGTAKVTASTGDVVAATMLFGGLAGLAVSNAEATFEMKIDHKNGTFIRLREIPDPPKPDYYE